MLMTMLGIVSYLIIPLILLIGFGYSTTQIIIRRSQSISNTTLSKNDLEIVKSIIEISHQFQSDPTLVGMKLEHYLWRIPKDRDLRIRFFLVINSSARGNWSMDKGTAFDTPELADKYGEIISNIMKSIARNDTIGYYIQLTNLIRFSNNVNSYTPIIPEEKIAGVIFHKPGDYRPIKAGLNKDEVIREKIRECLVDVEKLKDWSNIQWQEILINVYILQKVQILNRTHVNQDEGKILKFYRNSLEECQELKNGIIEYGFDYVISKILRDFYRIQNVIAAEPEFITIDDIL
jgi:hypothetical protein